jgi:hypothetical protein
MAKRRSPGNLKERASEDMRVAAQARDLERINNAADRLNAEAADALEYQTVQYFTILAKISGSRLAPPTNAPSTSSSPISSDALFGLTLPP